MAKWKPLVRLLFLKLLPAGLGLAALVLVIAWLAGAFTEKIEPGRREVTQRLLDDSQTTDVVHEVTKDYIEEAVGTLRAAGRAEISARVLARIESISVAAGDLVEPDDVLIKLDDAELTARVKQAEQALVAAEAGRDEANRAFERVENLFRKKASTKSAFDEAKARLDVAAAEEQRTTQALEEARIVLSYATIKAPRAGRVVDRLAEPGDTARPGRPLLVIYDAGSLRLEAPVLKTNCRRSRTRTASLWSAAVRGTNSSKALPSLC